MEALDHAADSIALASADPETEGSRTVDHVWGMIDVNPVGELDGCPEGTVKKE